MEYTVIINTSGEIISSDSHKLLRAIPSPPYKNSILDLVLPKLREEVLDNILFIKNGEIIKWAPSKKLFIKRFNYLVDSFIPYFSNNGEIEHIAIRLSEIEIGKKSIKIDEGKFEILFNQAHDAIFVTDIKGNFLEVNLTAVKRTGFTREKFLKLNIKNTPIKSSNQTYANYFQELMLFGESSALISYKHSNGSLIETEISGRKFIYDGQEAILHISKEVAGRHTYNIKDIESIIKAEEQQRSAFAYEIHEVLGPNLSLLKMYIESYLESDSNDQRASVAKMMKSIVEDSLNNVSEISNKLSPHILKNLGLKVAIEVLLMKMEAASNLNYNFKLDIPDTISKHVDIIIYRTVSELVENVNKHSLANKVEINAKIKNNCIIFEIEDDGAGFDVGEVFGKKDKKGLLNISNKLKSIKGTIDFKSEIGKGSTVKIEIPIDETKEN